MVLCSYQSNPIPIPFHPSFEACRLNSSRSCRCRSWSCRRCGWRGGSRGCWSSRRCSRSSGGSRSRSRRWSSSRLRRSGYKAIPRILAPVPNTLVENNLRRSTQCNPARRTTRHRPTINTLSTDLARLCIVRQLLRIRRIDNHDLSELTMRARCAVQKHGSCASTWHVEGTDIGLAIGKRYVTAVDTALFWSACGVAG